MEELEEFQKTSREGLAVAMLAGMTSRMVVGM